MNLRHILMMFSVVTTLCSCYEDKGNYKYRDDVNDFEIILNPVYSCRKEAVTFTITPKIEQTHYTRKDNLRYSWFYSKESDKRGEEISQSENLKFEIHPDDENFQYVHYFKLYVTDTITGAKQTCSTQLKIKKPYQGAWMILHSKENKARLGSVEYVGQNTLVNEDAYFLETGNKLTGNPCKLGVMNRFYIYGVDNSICQFFLFTTNPEETGILAQDEKFKQIANIREILPLDYNEFDVTKVRSVGKLAEGGVIVSNGKTFQGASKTVTMGMTGLSEEVAKDHNSAYVTHCTISSNIHLAFDSLNNRFLSLSTRDNKWTTTPIQAQMAKYEYIRRDIDNVQEINPNNIGADKQMVYLGPGYFVGKAISYIQWQRHAMYAFAVSRTIGKSYVFEFRSCAMTNPTDEFDIAPFSNYFVINTPEGVNGGTLMTSSYEYNRILFYAVDNKVYKLDFASANGVATLIYQHPDPQAKVATFQMARSYLDDKYAEVEESLPAAKTLGIGYNMPNGTGELVVLILDNTGKVQPGVYGNFPTVQRYTEGVDGQKFGPIKDIAYI